MRDQEAADWAGEILEQTLSRRESRTQAIAPYLYPFVLGEDGVAVFPATPLFVGNPPSLEKASSLLDSLGRVYAYLFLMPGVPTPKSVWSGPTFSESERASLPLGVPEEIIEEGDFDFYVFGCFVSNSLQRTFCVPLKGDRFGKLQILSGLYGGTFSSLGGVGSYA